MKARVKDTGQILEVMTVKLENGFYYSINRLEIESNNAPDHWQDVRERAAIAAMHAFCVSPSSYTGNIPLDKMAQHVVEVADALVERLKGE